MPWNTNHGTNEIIFKLVVNQPSIILSDAHLRLSGYTGSAISVQILPNSEFPKMDQWKSKVVEIGLFLKWGTWASSLSAGGHQQEAFHL